MTQFCEAEKNLLLALKWVGPSVIRRLERSGFCSQAAIARADVEAILASGAALTGSSCWQNSAAGACRGERRHGLGAAVTQGWEPSRA